jgi:WD40 repeat protein
MYHKETVEEYPLQVYASALVFSPADSLIRQLFQHEEQKGVAIKPDISNGWRDCLQTLESHTGYIRSVAFSHDSARLASASFDRTVKIWDAHSGACLQTLEGHTDNLSTVVFSHDSARLRRRRTTIPSRSGMLTAAHACRRSRNKVPLTFRSFLRHHPVTKTLTKASSLYVMIIVSG